MVMRWCNLQAAQKRRFAICKVFWGKFKRHFGSYQKWQALLKNNFFKRSARHLQKGIRRVVLRGGNNNQPNENV
jgi:hypothetical protein